MKSSSHKIHDLNKQINERIANEIEEKIRSFINMSDDAKQKALLATIEVKERQMRDTNRIGVHLVNSLKTLYNQCVVDKRTLTTEEKFDLTESIKLASRVFPEHIILANEQPTESEINGSV
jgi:hypothetical protein